MNCFFSFIYSFYLEKVNTVPVCNSNQILTNENGYVRCTCADGFFGKDCSRRKFNYLLAMIHSKVQVDWLHYKITKTSYFFYCTILSPSHSADYYKNCRFKVLLQKFFIS